MASDHWGMQAKYSVSTFLDAIRWTTAPSLICIKWTELASDTCSFSRIVAPSLATSFSQWSSKARCFRIHLLDQDTVYERCGVIWRLRAPCPLMIAVTQRPLNASEVCLALLLSVPHIAQVMIIKWVRMRQVSRSWASHSEGASVTALKN